MICLYCTQSMDTRVQQALPQEQCAALRQSSEDASK